MLPSFHHKIVAFVFATAHTHFVVNVTIEMEHFVNLDKVGYGLLSSLAFVKGLSVQVEHFRQQNGTLIHSVQFEMNYGFVWVQDLFDGSQEIKVIPMRH